MSVMTECRGESGTRNKKYLACDWVFGKLVAQG